jgi:RNA polymerase sigma-70 factor (ECF subfamily)
MEAALADIYDEYFDRVARYIYIRISDRAEAEDLAGEVFLKALRSLRSYRGTADRLPAWLFSIARNMVVDHYRRRSVRQSVPLDSVEIADGHDVDEAADTSLQIEALSRALPQLTEAQREVIGLRFFAGLSSAETGEVMGKSSGAVREMQRSAIVKLRELM